MVFDSYCKLCKDASLRKIRDANPERRKEINRRAILKYTYGLTPEQLEGMKIAQDNKCAICLLEKPLNIDHDHTTKQIRELLCWDCNVSFGKLKEDAQILNNMLLYLKKWKHAV